ncbi:MAG TPA: type II secretion system F family protein [Pirellulaceae bacterium]|nr:type II secretion system F family protein [Pirellulaceae bacterium]
MLTIIICIAAFVGVATLVGGVAFVFRGDAGRAAEERLDILTGAGGAGHKGNAAEKELNILSAAFDEGPGLLEKFFQNRFNFRRFLEQADSPISPSKFLAISGGLAGGSALLCLAVRLPITIVPPVAIVFGLLPITWLYFRRGRRLANFAKQLPEALELISRALRAGHSLASGFSLVAEEMPEPIAREFSRAYEAQNLGKPLDQALEEMSDRVPNLDLRFFATAVILQRQTGGDLAEILDKIGYIVRERFKIWGQVQALTGEGRLSGIVLLALPPALFVAMWRLNPTYCMMLFDDPMGHQMLAAAIILQVVGALVIRKIVNIKV